MSAGLEHKRVAQKSLEALVHEPLSELCLYAYWLCGDWTTAQSLIDATLAGEQRMLEGAGKSQAKALRRMITALHREHARHRKKQDASNQSEPVDRVDDKGSDAELQNLRIEIASLPTNVREPLVLQSIGYSIEDIAELLELTAVIVAARLVNARKQLQMLPNPDDETSHYTLVDS